MNISGQIRNYIEGLEPIKKLEINTLHDLILQKMAHAQLWFLDGRDADGKIVTNPSIGYGNVNLTSAQDPNRDFYQVGISANAAGISVYIMGLKDKNYLPGNYGERLNKAKVSGYCIKFRKLSDIDLDVLLEAIQDGVEQTNVAL